MPFLCIAKPILGAISQDLIQMPVQRAVMSKWGWESAVLKSCTGVGCAVKCTALFCAGPSCALWSTKSVNGLRCTVCKVLV